MVFIRILCRNSVISLQSSTQEEYGHLVLLALFDVIDDTVLVKKVIFPVSIQTCKDSVFAKQYEFRNVLLGKADLKFFQRVA